MERPEERLSSKQLGTRRVGISKSGRLLNLRAESLPSKK